MARWGEGLFDDDTALYVRDRFNAALAAGQAPTQAANSIAGDMPLGDGNDSRHVAVLALADLLASIGANVQAITDEALERIEVEMRDASDVPERDAVLVDLRRRLELLAAR